MAKQQPSQGVNDFVTAYKSFFFDLPLASLKWTLGTGEEKEAAEAAWKGYDAGVRVMAAAIDTLYRNPLFSDAFSRTVSAMLRWQQVGNAVSGAVFTSLWKATGAPTAAEVQGLAEQLRALENRLAPMAQKKDIEPLLEQIRALDARLHRAGPTLLHANHANHHEERAAA